MVLLIFYHLWCNGWYSIFDSGWKMIGFLCTINNGQINASYNDENLSDIKLIEKLEEELAYFKERVKNAESRLTTNQRDYKKNKNQQILF